MEVKVKGGESRRELDSLGFGPAAAFESSSS